jgi:hypothetical protein
MQNVFGSLITLSSLPGLSHENYLNRKPDETVLRTNGFYQNHLVTGILKFRRKC